MGWRVGTVAVSGDQRLAEPNGAARTNNIVVAPQSSSQPNKYVTFNFLFLHADFEFWKPNFKFFFSL